MVLMKDVFAIRNGGLDNSPQNRGEREAAKDYIRDYVLENGNPIPEQMPRWAEGCVPNVGIFKKVYI